MGLYDQRKTKEEKLLASDLKETSYNLEIERRLGELIAELQHCTNECLKKYTTQGRGRHRECAMKC